MSKTNVVPGVYRHYKGARYTVLFVAQNASNHDGRAAEKIVVYVSLTYGRIFTRSEREFTETIRLPNTNEEVQRFTPE